MQVTNKPQLIKKKQYIMLYNSIFLLKLYLMAEISLNN